MSAVNDPHYKKRATILKAMAHPSRLKMLEALESGEKCVCELQELVGSDMSTVSKHLSMMRAAGLVVDEKRGLKAFYRLRVPCVRSFFACIESVIESEDQNREVCAA